MADKLTGWVQFTGSDEQIAEIDGADSFIIKSKGVESHVMHHIDKRGLLVDCDEYWLIPDDPLRKMKIRWARTGQPVWIRRKIENEYFYWLPTTTPDWNIPNAEYSFIEFEKSVDK